MSEPLPPSALKAVGLFQNGKFTEAWQALEPELDACVSSSDAQQLAGQILKNLNRHAQALPYLAASADLAAERADYRTNLANTLMLLERAEEAIEQYKAALSLTPSFRAARLGLGRACLSIDMFREALAAASSLIDENADDAEAWNLQAQAQLQTEALRDAAHSAQRALDIAPAYVAASHTLANVLIEQADCAGARRALDRISGSASELPQVLAARARLALIEGDALGARDQLQRAIAGNAANTELQVLLARLRHLTGDPDFTEAMHQQVEQQRVDSRLRLMEARLLRASGRLDEALQILAPAIEVADKNPAFLHEAASVYLDTSEFESARRLAEAAWQAAPQVTEMIAQYAQCLLCLGDSEKPASLIAQLLVRRPLDQRFIAFDTSRARLADDAHYQELCDYERFVKTFEIPTPSGWSSLQGFLSDLKSELRARHARLNTPLDQSVRGGTQTPASLLHSDSEVINALIEAFDVSVYQYRESLGTTSAHPLLRRNIDCRHELRGCWSVMLRKEGYHVNHVHPQGWVSSAFYVEVPDEAKDAQRQSGWLKFGEPRYPVPGATAEKLIAPKEGNLALFPSYFWHGTTPLQNNFARLSVAFDVVPV